MKAVEAVVAMKAVEAMKAMEAVEAMKAVEAMEAMEAMKAVEAMEAVKPVYFRGSQGKFNEVSMSFRARGRSEGLEVRTAARGTSL
jgi:hypothetical protein